MKTNDIEIKNGNELNTGTEKTSKLKNTLMFIGLLVLLAVMAWLMSQIF